MSATAANVAPLNGVRFMEVKVKGRIEASRLYEGKRFTRLVAPAPDAYSRPQTVEVRSSRQKLGEVGEEITVNAVLGGYTRKPYKVTDKDTGEIVTLTPVDHTLDLLE
jgi:hypothetical protein